MPKSDPRIACHDCLTNRPNCAECAGRGWVADFMQRRPCTLCVYASIISHELHCDDQRVGEARMSAEQALELTRTEEATLHSALCAEGYYSC